MSVLALITARGGSKGLPRKNVLPVGGKPLIAWTIEAALASRCVSRVVLSSDDDEIMQVARSHGCEVPFRRPAELAGDLASSADVVAHALAQLPGHDHVLLLQPTSPLREAADIDAAFDLMQSHQAPACVSVCPVQESPYWMYRIEGGQQLRPLLPPASGAHRRQDLPPVYMLNGALYLAGVDHFRQQRAFLGPGCAAYVMPRERSLDIDTAEDLALADEELSKKHSSLA